MIVKMNSDGTIISTVESRFIRGSKKVNSITLFAPFVSTVSITCNFKLPSGTIYSGIMSNQGWNDDEGYEAWSYLANAAITSIEGKVELSFSISQNDTITKTPIINITVEDSVEDGIQEELDNPPTLNELMEIINSKITMEQLEIVLDDYLKLDETGIDTMENPVVKKVDGVWKVVDLNEEIANNVSTDEPVNPRTGTIYFDIT